MVAANFACFLLSFAWLLCVVCFSAFVHVDERRELKALLKIFINEIHYENKDKDVDEAVEIAFPVGTNISKYRIELYNGRTGKMYRSVSLSKASSGQNSNGKSLSRLSLPYLQDGNLYGDGIALVDPSGMVVQFLSYEGSFKATGSTAKGLTSTNIGVKEKYDSPVGYSLQLGGNGCYYQDFKWEQSRRQTMGRVNRGQTFSCRMNIPRMTYIPGDPGVVENGLLLSTGLTARKIAIRNQRVKLDTGGRSKEVFHRLPDGAAVFADKKTGGWRYVSNSEVWLRKGGVGALIFNAKGQLVGYERLLRGSSWNCGGGKTWWDTWLSCEEDYHGQIWEVDPWGRKPSRKTLMGSLGGDLYESAAYYNRYPQYPSFYVTTDSAEGPVLKFIPDRKAVTIALATKNYTDLLHTNQTGTAKIQYLVLKPNQSNPSKGTFYWSDKLSVARRNARRNYRFCEGIDIRKGSLYFTCKGAKLLFILDLDKRTYIRRSTRSGAFENEPDQVQRIIGENGEEDDILYFCEDGGYQSNGVHGRDRTGKFFTILENSGQDRTLHGETSGLAFSPDKKHMYVSYQHPGIIFDVTRTDGGKFGGDRLDIKYHGSNNGFPIN